MEFRYVHMEAGHAAQNLCLQAVAREMGAVVIGAFRDQEIHRILGLEKDETPLYVIPVGGHEHRLGECSHTGSL